MVSYGAKTKANITCSHFSTKSAEKVLLACYYPFNGANLMLSSVHSL